MVSTVTTSTVSILATALAGSLALIGILLLLALLIQKEVAISAGSRFEKYNRALNIGIVPLLIAFFLVVVMKVVEVLQ